MNRVRLRLVVAIKTDGALGRIRWRCEQRLEFCPNRTQGVIVIQQGLIDFRQPFEDGDVGGEVFAHLDKRADDVEAHFDGVGAVQDGGGHDGAMLGEGVRQCAATTVTAGCSHNL